jgi:hypothetical protein
VAAPNASWSKLQRGVGGAAGILPPSLPGVIVALADLDPQIAAELDGSAPLYGAVSGDLADPSFVFAMKLVDPRRARMTLLGDGGRSTKEIQVGGDAGAATSVTLVPSRPSTSPELALAISRSGYLLIARNAHGTAASGEALGHLAPYVTRTLPARPPPGDVAAIVEIPRRTLRSKLLPKIEELWKEGTSFLLGQDARARAERGRPPDFGDPAPIVAALDAAVGRRLAVLGDLEHVRVAVDVTDDASSVTFALTPNRERGGPARRWVDGMSTGDAAAIEALPATSLVALSVRDRESERAEQAHEMESAIVSALGSRLKEPHKLHEVIDAMTRSRDESFSLAYGMGDPPGLVLRAPVRDGDAAKRAIRGAVDLARGEPFKEFFRIRDISSTEEASGLGTISITTFSLQDKSSNEKHIKTDAGAPSGKAARSVGVANVLEHAGGTSVLLLGVGAEASTAVQRGARPDRTLADERAITRFTSALGTDASTILVAQPLRIDPKRSSVPTSPISVAVGRRGTDAFIRVDISDALLREAVRWQMGF